MSFARIGIVLRQELAFHLRRPLLICWLLLLTLFLLGLSSGFLRIESGDSAVGGAKATMTSEFAQAQLFSVLTPLIYTFFIAILVGLSILRDEEQKVGELLHATPLRPQEYVLGKFGAGLAVLLIVFVAHVLLAVFFNHVTTDAESSEYVGELDWWNYARPAVLFGLPTALLAAGCAFWIGARTRSAVAVFVLPLAGLGACIFFLWEFTPSWLDHRIDRALMLIDPTGFRWLQQTWLSVDRGVEFYNTAPVELDLPFALSRIAFALLGLFGGLWTALRFQVTPRNKLKRGRASKAVLDGGFTEPAALPGSAALTTLGMRTRRPSLLTSFVRILRVELRELRSQPGLYLFIPLILLETTGTALLQEGPFGTELLHTSGTLAVRAMPVLTLLVTLLLMFYTVESLRREAKVGLAGLRDSTPVRSIVILAGKITANAVVGAVILLAALLGSWIVLAFQGVYGLDPYPFLLVWGGLLVPTYFVWCAFIACAYSLLRNAYAAYAMGLAAIFGTGWLLFTGHMNWSRNWVLWSTINWSDFGAFPLDREALLWNRVLVLLAAALFLAMTLKFFPRTERDPQRTMYRLRPKSILVGALPLLPLILGVGGLYVWISSEVAHGWEGEYARREAKDYRLKNVETWRNAPQPDITGADIAVTLVPSERRLTTSGTFELENKTDTAMHAFALTANARWTELAWTLNGEPYETDDRAHLHVFEPDSPLEPGDSVSVGFDLTGNLHPHFSENGGGALQFVVPEGVVLNSFSPTFVPTVGFMEGVGFEEGEQPDPKEWADDFYEGQTPSGFGGGGRFSVRMQVTCPERYTANGIGVKTSDEVSGGLRTVVWETDHPVDFFNLVAGEYAVARGEGTAIFYLPAHEHNVPKMLAALDAARARYSEWFYPFPWSELKLSEFPALAGYAQGFATNITFSEGIGFLAKATEEVDEPFFVTAHEAAHQWWGNLLVPGEGPGGNILSEGMAHFSTILLTESEQGLARRIAFCRRIEERYGESRVADSERPLVKILGGRPGDTTVTYDKGGWVFWMLLNLMGRDACLAGLQDFIAHYQTSRDYPVLQDFTAHMRGYARDVEAFDAFVQQWFHEVVVPRFELRDVQLEEGPDGPVAVTLNLANVGTGRVRVEIGALTGPRFEEESTGVQTGPDDVIEAAESAEDADTEVVVRGDARISLEIGPDEVVPVRIPVDFQPELVLVDPDALVFQLQRKLAEHRF